MHQIFSLIHTNQCTLTFSIFPSVKKYIYISDSPDYCNFIHRIEMAER